MRAQHRCTWAFAGILCLLSSCSDGSESRETPWFPMDYALTYTEVRGCRPSGDHELNVVRVLAAPDAVSTYQDRNAPFSAGALMLKEEYEFGDDTCSGPLQQWTVMRKLAPATGQETMGWEWQRVNAERQVLDETPTRCVACHGGCGRPPDGHDGTCTIP